MTDLLSKLGIDWKLLAAQVVNFLILLLLLRKFVYKPVLDMLQKRRNIIARSLEEAKKAEEDVKKFEETKESELRQSRIKAKEIIDGAVAVADDQKAKIIAKAKLDSEKLIAEADIAIRMRKEQAAKDLERETGDLALGIMEKYFKSGIKKTEQEKIIRNIIAEM